jgi:2-polyprenyl-3-methyl-5-hydroxy-6-metoxy-1,4-benzoquinol methylase
MEKFECYENCPICSSPSLKALKKSTFDFAHLDKDQIKITDLHYGRIWDLSLCRNCLHIFANPSPTPEFINSLYSGIEDPLYEEEAPGRSKNFLRILTYLEKLRPTKGTLFDVGAATAILLNIARERGWQPDGIEPSSWAVKVAEDKYHLQIREGFFEKAELEPNSYQAVTMVDFIEHTPRPVEVVAKAYEILSPDGILCLVTPDLRSLAARVAGKKWWHFRPAHLAYFSPESLETLLHRAGFKVLKNRKYSWTFSAHYLASRKTWPHFLLKNAKFASFLKKIPIKLVLGDSFEIYARRETKD